MRPLAGQVAVGAGCGIALIEGDRPDIRDSHNNYVDSDRF